jgi:preprotein translocase subunit SecG
MQMMASLALVVQILSALGVIVLVLLQHGKGADMGAAFGSGNSGSLFGATGSANFLSRLTGGLATLFFVCTLLLAFFAATSRVAPTGSVMDRPVPGVVTPPGGAAGPGSIPGAAPGVVPGAPGSVTPGAGAQQKSGPAGEIPR